MLHQLQCACVSVFVLFSQLALTHTSYTVNYGTNPDHARNSLTNCGMRQVEYGDRKIHFVHTRKRGINDKLLNIAVDM